MLFVLLLPQCIEFIFCANIFFFFVLWKLVWVKVSPTSYGNISTTRKTNTSNREANHFFSSDYSSWGSFHCGFDECDFRNVCQCTLKTQLLLLFLRRIFFSCCWWQPIEQSSYKERASISLTDLFFERQFLEWNVRRVQLWLSFVLIVVSEVRCCLNPLVFVVVMWSVGPTLSLFCSCALGFFGRKHTMHHLNFFLFLLADCFTRLLSCVLQFSC